MPLSWKVLRSVYLFQSPFMRLRQDACALPHGHTIPDYYVVEERDVGMVFALTPARELLLVEQYKHGIGQVCLELPAGLFESDDPAQAAAEARREFREETGYDADHYRPLGSFIQNPTRMTSRIHFFLALDVYPVGAQQLDANEAIRVHLVPLEQALQQVRDGTIDAVGTVAGILRAYDYLQRGL